MLSTVPAFSMSEPGLVNQFQGSQTGFTPWDWDCSYLFSTNQPSLEPAVPSPCYGESDSCLVKINSGFDDIKTGSDDIRTGSDENYTGFIKIKPGFDDSGSALGVPDEPVSDDQKQWTDTANFYSGEQNKLIKPEMTEEKKRKRKRMESNRESAKRSRMRKQNHINNLRNQVNQLDLENRELKNRLQIFTYQLQRVNTDNIQLVTEQEILRLRLSEMRRFLMVRQLQQQQQWELNNRRMSMPEQHPSCTIDHMIYISK